MPSEPRAGLGEAVKTRESECRQDDTPSWVTGLQRELLSTFDRTCSPEAVCEHLRDVFADLEAGNVESEPLLIDPHVSKRAEEYSHGTVEALKRSTA